MKIVQKIQTHVQTSCIIQKIKVVNFQFSGNGISTYSNIINWANVPETHSKTEHFQFLGNGLETCEVVGCGPNVPSGGLLWSTKF